MSLSWFYNALFELRFLDPSDWPGSTTVSDFFCAYIMLGLII
jgi:hypothetical protein